MDAVRRSTRLRDVTDHAGDVLQIIERSGIRHPRDLHEVIGFLEGGPEKILEQVMIVVRADNLERAAGSSIAYF